MTNSSNVPPIPGAGVSKVQVPFKEKYFMPQTCTCCGNPSVGPTRLWRPFVINPMTRKMKLYDFPLCAHCRQTINAVFGFSWPYIVVYVIIVVVTFIIMFSSVGNFFTAWIFLILAAIVVSIIRSIVSSRIRKNPNGLYTRIVQSVTSKMDDQAKVTFSFTNTGFARQFASLNSGQLMA